jgi:hypothetical protein
MSTAKDEAEIGRIQPQVEEESGYDTREEDAQDESPSKSPGSVPVGFAEQDGDEHNISDGSFGSSGPNSHGWNLIKDRNIESSPGWGRPSSADGSLSTPDDTPSIQVRGSRSTSHLAIDGGTEL